MRDFGIGGEMFNRGIRDSQLEDWGTVGLMDGGTWGLGDTLFDFKMDDKL